MRSRLAVLALLLVSGCNDSPGLEQPPPSGCDVPAHTQWLSTTREECGLGWDPDAGPSVVLCHWTITLEPDGTGTWSHSDVSQAFTYSCAGDALEIVIGGSTSTAAHDAASGHLTYEGVEYCPADEVGCPPGA